MKNIGYIDSDTLNRSHVMIMVNIVRCHSTQVCKRWG